MVGIAIWVMSSTIGLKTCATAAGTKKPKSKIKRKEKEHDKKVLLAKSKSNSIEILIFKSLIEFIISHDEFVLINNALKEYDDKKEDVKSKDLGSLPKISVYL